MITADHIALFPQLADEGRTEPVVLGDLAAQNGQHQAYLGDMVILERSLTPTEAHMLCSCLQSAGIHADAGDTYMVQANSLLSIAVGGASVRVPSTQLAEAKDVVAAFHRGDFDLGDDFDPDETVA